MAGYARAGFWQTTYWPQLLITNGVVVAGKAGNQHRKVPGAGALACRRACQAQQLPATACGRLLSDSVAVMGIGPLKKGSSM
jgi:hypothetical protein